MKRVSQFVALTAPAAFVLLELCTSFASAGDDPALVPAKPHNFTIPIVDVSDESGRQIIVERRPDQYLGHPTTVLMADQRTIYCTYPLGHGGPAAVLKKSVDTGLTWSDRLEVPENWATATNCPCLHRLTGPDGIERLFVFEGLKDMREAVSLDQGQTWTPFAKNGFHCIVPPITIIPISGGRHLAMYDRGLNDQDRPPLTIWQSISSDGGLTWGPDQKILDIPDANPNEPAMIRSPDGKQILAFIREETGRYNSLYIISNDEGETWSKPAELSASLTGHRHLARYAPDGRLVVAFRDMATESPTHGHFVAWVGTYDDVLKGSEGQYRALLLRQRGALNDCGYPGLEVLPDGTFVATTYVAYQPGGKNSIISVRFTLPELDKKLPSLSK